MRPTFWSPMCLKVKIRRMPFKERCFKRIGITSFKGRLRFWFICLATLIVLLISIPFVFLGREQQRNIAMINIDKMINIQQVAIDSWLEEKLSDIKAISQLPAIKENNLLEMKETMETFDNNHLEFNGIVYVNKNGISEVDTSGEAGLNLSDRTYYRKGKEGKTLITDILIGRQSHQPIIIISAPVYDYDQQFKGDLSGNCLYVSPAVKEILQYGFQELIGYNCYSFIHRDDAEIVRKSHEKLLKAGYAVVAYRIRRKDGKYIWLESSIKHLHEKNSEKEQVIVISRNITERKLAEKKLQEANRLLLELSIKDGLTGAWNRRAFDECLTKEWNRAVRNGTSLSLIMIDLDYFKPHIMIDTVIKRGMIV